MTQIIPFVMPALIVSYRGAECFLKGWVAQHRATCHAAKSISRS
jgi:hypothetical protein